jgi:sulfur relay (sulfurtransferase) complex TusBCD TusD component (DsrE family)
VVTYGRAEVRTRCLAGALAMREHNDLRMFLLDDAVAAKAGQTLPQGFYNL